MNWRFKKKAPRLIRSLSVGTSFLPLENISWLHHDDVHFGIPQKIFATERFAQAINRFRVKLASRQIASSVAHAFNFGRCSTLRRDKLALAGTPVYVASSRLGSIQLNFSFRPSSSASFSLIACSGACFRTYGWASCASSLASAMELGEGVGQIVAGSKFRRTAVRVRIAQAAARQTPSGLRPDCLLISAGRSSSPPGSPCHRPRCEPSFAGPWLNGHRLPFRDCPRTTHAPRFRARSTNAQTLEDRGKGT